MEKHNGVWGGCWCVAFHVKPDTANQTAASNRAYKERLVRANNDRDRRKQGVAEAGLAGALRLIAAKGGGTVDGYPIATRGKPYSSSFLFGGTESMFAAVGFHPLGALGTSKVVMRRAVRRR